MDPGEVHVVTAVNVGGRDKVKVSSSRVDRDVSHDDVNAQEVGMSRERRENEDLENEDLTPEDLEDHEGEPLPERTAMTIVNPGHGFYPLPLPVEPIDGGETPIDGGPYTE